MERIILLKTQLAEASKLAGSSELAKQRLAVILLDNFIEIQLSQIMKQRFFLDDLFTSRPAKHNSGQRKKILYNYDDMLNACVAEGTITIEERDQLLFCHNVRNNLYHQAEEEPLLTLIALAFLNDIIVKYQPVWRSGRDVVSWNFKTIDPYTKPTETKYPMTNVNSKETWDLFLREYFNWGSDKVKAPSQLIAEHLLNKIDKAEYYYQILLEHKQSLPLEEHWELNEFVLFNSFYNLKKFELKCLQERYKGQEYSKAHNELFLNYKKKWVFIKPTRIATLKAHSNKIVILPPHKALKKFLAFRSEVTMIYEALSKAVGDWEAQIDSAMDHARAKV